jgi:hypothetical protein
MNASRGAVPAKFPIEACVDGSNVYLYNSTTLVLSVGTEGSAGQPTTTPTNYTFGVEAARLKHGGEWVLMPGDKMRIPIGSASAGVKVELDTSAERYYALANTVATFIPDGKLLDSVNVFADFIATVNADFIDYQNCLAGRNYLGRAGCLARFSGAIGIAVKDLGLGLAAHVVSAILGVLLAAKTFIQWAGVQVPQVTTFINPPPIMQAAVASSSTSTPTPPTASAGTGTWTATEGPANFGTESRVSCVSASQCVATGGNGYDGLLLTNSGGSWAAVQTPSPANLGSEGFGVDGVSCSSASQCVAVGSYEDTAENEEGLLLTDSGGSWTVAQAPLPANAADFGSGALSLSGVSCPSASQCVAVGGYQTTDGDLDRGLLLTDSGGSWTAAQAPVPANYADDAGLDGVSCLSASQCVAVGSYEDTSGDYVGLLLTDSGGSWTAAQAPLPANATSPDEVSLTGVSCSSASQCVAVGTYEGNAEYEGLLLTDSGGSWTAAQAPLPANAETTANNSGSGAYPFGVSCSSASQCVAVGYYEDTASYWDGLVLTDSGGSWTAAQAPVPANADINASYSKTNALVTGVSCPSASQCVAVGYYPLTPNENGGLLLTGAG